MEGPVYFPPTYRLVEGRDVCVCALAQRDAEGPIGLKDRQEMIRAGGCLFLFPVYNCLPLLPPPFQKRIKKTLRRF